MVERGSQDQVLYEEPAPGVARLVMNRPERRNAQGRRMTYEIDAGFRRACHDDNVRVIILAGAGPHFSAGHDLAFGSDERVDADTSLGLWGQYEAPGWEGNYSREREIYLDITERWRNAPKPTIAEVQGACVAGGLMLAWACDLIVASEDARFRDTTIDMAMPGVEFFHHPWELGVRKGKEFLFTGAWLGAREAEAAGMVNRVVPARDLRSATLELARTIAAKDRFALKLAKEAMNASQDAMGRRTAMTTAFHLHQIGHMQNLLVRDFMIAYEGLAPAVRKLVEAQIAQRAARRSATADPDRSSGPLESLGDS